MQGLVIWICHIVSKHVVGLFHRVFDLGLVWPRFSESLLCEANQIQIDLSLLGWN